MIYDCIITGAGASGLFCAASVSHPLKGLILEKSKYPGLKLLMSGSGQCNITHAGSIKDFISCYGDNGRKIRKCLYKYNTQKNPDRNKVMKINERWEELREESNANIQSEEGILKRQIRSIQTEGHFGDIKENESFRRFNYRSEEKVYKEFMLYAIGRNIMKYHRFLHHETETYEGKKEQKAA